MGLLERLPRAGIRVLEEECLGITFLHLGRETENAQSGSKKLGKEPALPFAGKEKSLKGPGDSPTSYGVFSGHPDDVE
jgi:hypothetical protein